MSAIPVIDVSGLLGDRDAKLAVARQIDAACRKTGFLSITGHEVSPLLIARVRKCALAFFNLPEAEKRRIERQPPNYRGYIPMASEGLARSSGQIDAAADLKEAFSMGPVDVLSDSYHTSPVAAAHSRPTGGQPTRNSEKPLKITIAPFQRLPAVCCRVSRWR